MVQLLDVAELLRYINQHDDPEVEQKLDVSNERFRSLHEYYCTIKAIFAYIKPALYYLCVAREISSEGGNKYSLLASLLDILLIANLQIC